MCGEVRLYYQYLYVIVLSHSFTHISSFLWGYGISHSTWKQQHGHRGGGRGYANQGAVGWIDAPASVSGAGHLLWREEAGGRTKQDHFHSTHYIPTWLQSAPSVTRPSISVSDARFMCPCLLKLLLAFDVDAAR